MTRSVVILAAVLAAMTAPTSGRRVVDVAIHPNELRRAGGWPRVARALVGSQAGGLLVWHEQRSPPNAVLP